MPALPNACRRFLLALSLLLPGIGHANELAPVSDAGKWGVAQRVIIEEQRVLDAVIEAVNKATLSAQTSGRVTSINFDVDDYVSKGDILIQFRNKEQRAAFDAAKAGFEEAGSEYKRVQDIYAKKLVAKAALDKAEARFKAAKAKLDQANESLENTIIRAPYSGIVVKRHIEVGELATPGRPLMSGISLETLRANVELPQDIVATVRKNARAYIILPGGKHLAAGKITVSPYADTASHTFQVRVDLPTGEHGVYPGMFVKVAFVIAEAKHLVVPASSVSYRSEVSAVYVKDKKGKLHYRQVRVGRFVPEYKGYEILAGLDEGEEVALDPVAAAAQFKQAQ